MTDICDYTFAIMCEVCGECYDVENCNGDHPIREHPNFDSPEIHKGRCENHKEASND